MESNTQNIIQQRSLTPHPHRNQQLFSDYYLNSILPSRADWQMLAVEAEGMLHDLQGLFASYTPSDKEAQVEDDFIKPVLRRLGQQAVVREYELHLRPVL